MQNKVVFLYPGQGSQQVGMGVDLYDTYGEAHRLFDQADKSLGFSLSRLCFEGPEKDLNRDLNAQLAVYTLSCIITDVLRSNNIFPDFVSGYSSGFYAAAYSAGCFNFINGLKLVRRAGEILLDGGQKINGGMAVIFGLSLEKVKEICQSIGDVQVALINTPRQIIISGLGNSIKKVTEVCLTRGALDAYPLSTATAYHSRYMGKSKDIFLKEFSGQRFMDPKQSLVSYLSLNLVSDGNELVDVMAEQLSGPVRWADLIRLMCDEGAGVFLEVGPGNTLSRTVRWIDRNAEIRTTAFPEKLLKAMKRCREKSVTPEPAKKNLGANKYECRKRLSI